jgi:hypothetical protein
VGIIPTNPHQNSSTKQGLIGIQLFASPICNVNMRYTDYVSINILVWKKGMLHLLPFVLSLIQRLIKVICNSTMSQLTPLAANMRWVLDDGNTFARHIDWGFFFLLLTLTNSSISPRNQSSSLTLSSAVVSSAFGVTCEHEDRAFLMRVRHLTFTNQVHMRMTGPISAQT